MADARTSGRADVRGGWWNTRRVISWIVKPVIWAGALTPAALLVWWAFYGGLGANPIQKITHWTGRSALTLLMITLTVTPIRRVTGFNPIIQIRRPLGLFAFFYAVLHFGTYFVFVWFDWSVVLEDLVERRYITVGFTAFVLMIPLALTSTKGSIRRLGKNWVKLHRLIYVSAFLGVLHFLWKVKADTRLPLVYGGVLLLLMLFRWPKRKGGVKRSEV